MQMPAFTMLNHYALRGGADAFRTAAAALVRRVRDEGGPGILSYRYFVNAGDGTALGVVDYRDGAAWIGHHDLAMAWPEMQAMHGTARLERSVCLGDVPAEVLDWLAASSMQVELIGGCEAAGGFVRD